MRLALAVVALCAVLSLSACAEPAEVEPGPAPPPAETAAAEPPAPGRPDLAELDPAWVTVFDPAKAWSGYNLALFRRQVPVLLDMNGRLVHAWPQARVKSRIRLLPDGNLLGLALGRALVEYDWDGELVWRYPTGDALPHHDVIRTRAGNTMTIVLRTGELTDDLIEVDRDGNVVWQWRSGEHLASYIAGHGGERADGDLTHINSVQELPENRWHDAGDDRFRPGNLLISARNLDAVFVIERRSGRVAWTYDAGLDMQHEALMIEPGNPGAGSILILSNGYRNRYHYRQSEVVAVHPQTGEVVWEYRADGFYTPTGGVEQPLPNGNVLITSTRGGRVFEVTRGGETVWEWAPSFYPTRLRRVPFDHTPQLAALEPPPEAAVTPAPGYRFVDPPTYRFARPGSLRTIRVDGRQQRVLKQNDVCQTVLVPPAASVELGYGVADGNPAALRFLLTARPQGEGSAAEIFRDALDGSADSSRRRQVDLGRFALQWVELCLAVDGDGADAAYWRNPVVRAGAAAAARDEDGDAGLTAEELEARREHLRALGYVD